MAAIVGYAGSVKIGAATVAELNQWELPLQSDLYDVSSFGDQWKDYLPGLIGAEPKLSGFFDPTDTNGQVALQNAQLNGTSITLDLYVDGTHFYSGTAFVKDLDIKAAVNAAITFDATCAFSGAISYT